MHNYFTNDHIIVLSTGSLQSTPCQVAQVFQMQHNIQTVYTAIIQTDFIRTVATK